MAHKGEYDGTARVAILSGCGKGAEYLCGGGIPAPFPANAFHTAESIGAGAGQTAFDSRRQWFAKGNTDGGRDDAA